VTLWLSIVALITAVAALGYALLVGRQSGATASLLARHRHGHTIRDGVADPGAARSARAGGRRVEPARGPETTAMPAIPPDTTSERPRLPRPGEIGRDR
jgi:hypothetical protein